MLQLWVAVWHVPVQKGLAQEALAALAAAPPPLGQLLLGRLLLTVPAGGAQAGRGTQSATSRDAALEPHMEGREMGGLWGVQAG